MGTQKTRLEKNTLTPKVEEKSSGLSIPEVEFSEEVELQSDDEEFYGEPEEYHGRKLRRLSNDDINQIAKDEKRKRDSIEMGKGPSPQKQESLRKMASNLLPDSFKQPQAQDPRYTNPSEEDPHRKRLTLSELALKKERSIETAQQFGYLSTMQKAATEKGDLPSAARIQGLMNEITVDYELTENAQALERHPALTKLVNNLGLEKIKREVISWGGSEWMFAPLSARLDYWIVQNVSDDRTNGFALAIAASLVGLDGVPLYEVLGIPLEKEIKVRPANVDNLSEEELDQLSQGVTIPLFLKECTCNNFIKVTDKECPTCKKTHDVFDVPLDLRVEMANKFAKFLESSFGPYEKLADLYNLKLNKVKDRNKDGEQLFPLVWQS